MNIRNFHKFVSENFHRSVSAGGSGLACSVPMRLHEYSEIIMMETMGNYSEREKEEMGREREREGGGREGNGEERGEEKGRGMERG